MRQASEQILRGRRWIVRAHDRADHGHTSAAHCRELLEIAAVDAADRKDRALAGCRCLSHQCSADGSSIRFHGGAVHRAEAEVIAVFAIAVE